MGSTWTYDCQCGKKLAVRFLETVMPEEVIKHVYCPHCLPSFLGGLLLQYQNFTIELDEDLLLSQSWLLAEMRDANGVYYDNLLVDSPLIVSEAEAKRNNLPYELDPENGTAVVNGPAWWEATCPTFDAFVRRQFWWLDSFKNLAELDYLLAVYKLYRDEPQDNTDRIRATDELIHHLTTKVIVPEDIERSWSDCVS